MRLYDTSLKADLSDKDKQNIDFVEAYELLQMTARPKTPRTTITAHQWVKIHIKLIRNKHKHNNINNINNPDLTNEEMNIKNHRRYPGLAEMLLIPDKLTMGQR